MNPRLAALFLVALAGVLAACGVAAARVGLGRAFVLLVLLLTVAVVRQARRLVRARVSGRTCTCCTGSVHDPVKVI